MDRDILGPMRLPFLFLTPACVLLGVATAFWTSGRVSFPYVILAFAGGVSAHISVNSLNEYFDFKSGLDFKTKRTPFSGGSGTLPGNPGAARRALVTGLTALVVTILIGIYFVILRGLLLLPLGLVGIMLVFFYTNWFTRNPLLCLIAPGLGFGPIMVMGTHFVLTASYSSPAGIASLIPFFLVSNLLLLNQFPDVEADRDAGRRHLPIAVGLRVSSLVYGAFLLLAYIVILFGVRIRVFPAFTMLGLLTIPAALIAFYGAFRYGENIKKLQPYMGLNVIVVILTPVLVAIGLFVG